MKAIVKRIEGTMEIEIETLDDLLKYQKNLHKPLILNFKKGRLQLTVVDDTDDAED
jgi:hypothetical protein